jgi:hypothetical protein
MGCSGRKANSLSHHVLIPELGCSKILPLLRGTYDPKPLCRNRKTAIDDGAEVEIEVGK